MKKEKGMKYGLVLGTTLLVIMAGFGVVVILNEKDDILTPDISNDDVGKWQVVAEVDSRNIVGENSPGSGTAGWLSTFCLDYDQDPGTVLANNATDWSADANTRGYVDTDDTDTDLASEDPFYFVVRCRFNDSVKSGGEFQGDRCRCTLTVSGDETISGVALTGDDSDISGGGRAVISQNDSADDYIWINFVWDDNSDGYRILDDGSLDWSITVEMKY